LVFSSTQTWRRLVVPPPPPPHRLIFFKFVKYSGRGSSVDGDPSTKYRWWIGNSTD
jgi:hypothetical protein